MATLARSGCFNTDYNDHLDALFLLKDDLQGLAFPGKSHFLSLLTFFVIVALFLNRLLQKEGVLGSAGMRTTAPSCLFFFLEGLEHILRQLNLKHSSAALTVLILSSHRCNHLLLHSLALLLLCCCSTLPDPEARLQHSSNDLYNSDHV